MTMSVFVYDAVDLCKYSTKKIYKNICNVFIEMHEQWTKNTIRADPDMPPFLSWDLIPESACEGFFVKKQPLY